MDYSKFSFAKTPKYLDPKKILAGPGDYEIRQKD